MLHSLGYSEPDWFTASVSPAQSEDITKVLPTNECTDGFSVISLSLREGKHTARAVGSNIEQERAIEKRP